MHDVTGGVFEWCDAPLENGMSIIRGGGWSNVFRPMYRLATRVEAAGDYTSPSTGMRLIATRVE